MKSNHDRNLLSAAHFCLVAVLAGLITLQVGKAAEGGADGPKAAARKLQPDSFGHQEDGKEKSHDGLVKSGWVYLFDGRIPQDPEKRGSIGLWRGSIRGEPEKDSWTVVEEDGERILRNRAEGGKRAVDLISLQEFLDFDLHAEVRLPEAKSDGGIFLRGSHEVQLRGRKGEPGKLGTADMGALYGLRPPSEAAGMGPGVWQTVEASIRGSRITVRLNGRVVQDEVDIGARTDKPKPAVPERAGPIVLQGDGRSVDFRNIRVRPASASLPAIRRISPQQIGQLRKTLEKARKKDQKVEKNEKLEKVEKAEKASGAPSRRL